MWDLIVSVPDHCLSFYFVYYIKYLVSVYWKMIQLSSDIMRISIEFV